MKNVGCVRAAVAIFQYIKKFIIKLINQLKWAQKCCGNRCFHNTCCQSQPKLNPKQTQCCQSSGNVCKPGGHTLAFYLILIGYGDMRDAYFDDFRAFCLCQTTTAAQKSVPQKTQWKPYFSQIQSPPGVRGIYMFEVWLLVDILSRRCAICEV